MNFQNIEKVWGSVEIYREARAWFIDGMDMHLSNYDGVVDEDGLIMSKLNEDAQEIYNVPASRDEILNHRKNKFLKIGRNKGFVSHLDDIGTLSMKKNKINIFIENFLNSKVKVAISLFFLILVGYFLYSL